MFCEVFVFHGHWLYLIESRGCNKPLPNLKADWWKIRRLPLVGPEIHEHTLVLNSTFEPLNIVHWQKAIQLIFQGKVEVLEQSQRMVRTISNSYRLPSVMRLIKYVPTVKKKGLVRFSRTNIISRDQQSCQYCGRKRPIFELTLDHIIPVTQGGKRTWENIVTACLPCNQRKGGRTPTEASMKLLRKPIQPEWLPIGRMNYYLQSTPDQWRLYLSWQNTNR